MSEPDRNLSRKGGSGAHRAKIGKRGVYRLCAKGGGPLAVKKFRVKD